MSRRPAARVGDLTGHGGTIVGPGASSVLLGGEPAAVHDDHHGCPALNPGMPAHPHRGGPLVATTRTVLIDGRRPARLGDTARCVGPPSTIVSGCATIVIGDGVRRVDAAAAREDARHSQTGCNRAEDADRTQRRRRHVLDINVVDATGKPITGVGYMLAGPRDYQRCGSLFGRLTDLDVPYGYYRLALQAVTSATWSTDETDAGEVVGLSARVCGFEDGVRGVFVIHRRCSAMQDQMIDVVPANVKAGVITATWRSRDHAEAQSPRYHVPPTYYFSCRVGTCAGRSGILSLRLRGDDGSA